MLSDLHDIFHDVARRNLEGFSDDPRFLLRVMYAKGEEIQEPRGSQQAGEVTMDTFFHREIDVEYKKLTGA